MNIRTLTLMTGIIAAISLAGCGSDSSTASPDAGKTSASTGGTSGAACDMAYTCSAAITPPNNDPSKLCSGTIASNNFTVLGTCACGGACASKCGASLCAQMPPSLDCLTCLMDSTVGCGKESALCNGS